MAVANGYGKTVTSGSVFMYDVGDTRNSYRGEPTVNAFGTYPTDLYGWTTSGNACTLSRDTIQSPVGNTPLKMVTTGNDAYTGTYASSYWNITAASSGQTWTISVWAKANQNTVGQIFHFGANSSGNIIDFNAIGISLTTEWTRYSYTRTFTDGNVVAIQTRLDGADTFQSGDIIWWDGLQVEQKPNPTQFTIGTRSVTQGLLPLIGNSTIDLSNVSFDSNAQKIFDGTDDYIQSSFSNFNTTNGSIECVIYPETGGGSDQMVLNVGGTTTFGASRILRILNGYWSFATYGSIDQDWNSIAQVSYNTWNHVVMNWEGTTLSIYVNNIPYNIVKTGVTTPAGTLLRAGAAVWNLERYYKGKISIVKIYNRALSAAEVQQNYNKYKTRFNLP
jgi:predicted secreted protein